MTDHADQSKLLAVDPLGEQIHAICDALAGDAGFMAQQEATALQKRAGEVARGQEPTKFKVATKSALAECAEYHAKLAGKCAINGWMAEANMHLRYSVACSEANEQ